MAIKKSPPLPECNDRYFEPTNNGLGGIVTDHYTACCPLTTYYHKINCKIILSHGKCPHKLVYPREPIINPTNSEISPEVRDWIELRKKAQREDEEILCYLDEIDPLYGDE